MRGELTLCERRRGCGGLYGVDDSAGIGVASEVDEYENERSDDGEARDEPSRLLTPIMDEA